MIQQLKTLSALAVDLGFLPSAHTAIPMCPVPAEVRRGCQISPGTRVADDYELPYGAKNSA